MNTHVQNFFEIRIGRFFFAIQAQYVRRALPVVPHIDVPLMRPNFGGIVLYNKRFVPKLFLDSLLGIGLYRTSVTVTTDSTVILEVDGTVFCSTVNEVDTVASIGDSHIMAVEKSPEFGSPIFPRRDYLLGYFEHRQKSIYILDMLRLHHDSFAVGRNV
jgi:chemotaxis signal transduction protein